MEYNQNQRLVFSSDASEPQERLPLPPWQDLEENHGPRELALTFIIFSAFKTGFLQSLKVGGK